MSNQNNYIVTSILSVILLNSCAQSGSRLDEMETKVAMMNQRLESMSQNTEKHIEQRQELLNRIQAEIKPVENITDETLDLDIINTSPSESTSIQDIESTDIQSVPIESLSGNGTTNTAMNSTVNAFVQAMEKMEQKQYSEAAYLFHAAYQNQETLATVREESLFKAGECFYLSQDWNQTIDTHLRFFQEYPQSAKMPNVLLQIGRSYQTTNQTDRANYVYQYLRQHYPNSEEAIQVNQN